MKKIKIQILFATVLLGSVVFMQGMRVVKKAGKQGKTRTHSTQSWSDFIKSIFYQTPQATTEKVSPRSGSVFVEPVVVEGIMTDEEALGIEIQHLLTAHREDWIAPNGLSYNKVIFDEHDLEVAKQKIDEIIKKNPDSIEYIFQNNKNYYFLRRKYGAYRSLEGTMLDEVFYQIFSGEGYPDLFTPSENTSNYINLAQHLIEKGVKINQRNEKMYGLIYSEVLMPFSKKESTGTRYGTELESEMVKAQFEELDPLLMKVAPELTQMIEEAKAERNEYDKRLKIEPKIKDKIDYGLFIQKKNEFKKEHSLFKDDRHSSSLYEYWMLSEQDPDFFMKRYDEQLQQEQLQKQDWE